jgi:hypothetical protein
MNTTFPNYNKLTLIKSNLTSYIVNYCCNTEKPTAYGAYKTDSNTISISLRTAQIT